MATADVQTQPAEPAPALPDYLTNPDAVLGDKEAKWRYGRAPDYSKTRKVFAETKKMSHQAGSLPDLVQNLVKNWEVEASFKMELDDWRTIDHENYSFAINGSDPQTAEHMLQTGTYNAIISPNEYYSPEYSDFSSSHKTFKRMMPNFAWEVLEVYSGPPTVSFRWRHWGVMKNDYVGFNNKGEKVTAPSHGGAIDIQGVTVATVNEKVQLQSVRTWFDPLDMFRQIAPNGVVKKEAVNKNLSPSDALDSTQAAEIDQTPRPIQTSTNNMPDRTDQPASASSSTETSAPGSFDASKLVEGMGCPFAGTNPKDSVAPFMHPTGAEADVHRSADSSSVDSEWSKVSHPKTEAGAGAGASAAETFGAGCPFSGRQ